MKLTRLLSMLILTLLTSGFAMAEADPYLGTTTIKARGEVEILPDENRVTVEINLQCFKTPEMALRKLDEIKVKVIEAMKQFLELDRDRYIAKGPSIFPQTLYISKEVIEEVLDTKTGKVLKVKNQKQFPDPECTNVYKATERITLRKTVDFEQRHRRNEEGESRTGFEDAGKIHQALTKVVITNQDKVEGITGSVKSQHNLSDEARKFAEAQAETIAEAHFKAQLKERVRLCGMEKYWIKSVSDTGPVYIGLPGASAEAYDKAFGGAEAIGGEGVGAPLISPEGVVVQQRLSVVVSYMASQESCRLLDLGDEE